MSLATFISRILGLVREQAFAILFGAGFAMDAFIVAFRIPNLLRDLLAEGAMSAALIPTFVAERKTKGDEHAWRVAGLVFRVMFLGVGILALLGILFAPQLVDLIAPEFAAIAGKSELTTRMTRIIFPYFPLVVLAAAYMAVLNSCGVYFLPSLASALFNATSVGVGIALTFVVPQFGMHPIEGMAIGVVVGGLVQAFCQLPSLFRQGYRYPKKKPGDPPWYRHPALKKMFSLMGPQFIGQAAILVNFTVVTVLASEVSGAVSWLHYSFRLVQFPIGVFGVALAIAALPHIAGMWVDKDYRGIESTLLQTLRRNLAVNLPATAGLFFLGAPIVQLIFEYGRFTPEDTRATALALGAHAIGLLAYSAVKVLVPAFYGMGNTRIPVIAAVVSVFVNLGLCFAFIKPFGFWGLALAMSLTNIFKSAFLLVCVKRLLVKAGGQFRHVILVRGFFGHFAVALGMGSICYLTMVKLQAYFPDQWLVDWFSFNIGEGWDLAGVVISRMARVFIVLFESVILVWGFAKLLRLKDTTEVFEIIMKKLKNRASR